MILAGLISLLMTFKRLNRTVILVYTSVPILILMISVTGGKITVVTQNIDSFVNWYQTDQEPNCQIMNNHLVDVTRDGGSIMELVTDHLARI